MDKEEFAELLTGSEYPLQISPHAESLAQEDRIVIIYGASDDLMEFRGAINDEVGAYDGTAVLVDREGLIPSRDSIDEDDEDAMLDLLMRKKQGIPIAAIWDRDGFSWQYETTIPHATFMIDEDGEHYCKGIVFSLDHLTGE